jgi:hypothetical protein
LHKKGFVEMQPRVECRTFRGGRLVAKHERCRVPRQHAQREKHERRECKHDEQRRKRAPDNG